MRKDFKSRLSQKWKNFGKRGMSFALIFAMLIGYISWSGVENTPASEETLPMTGFPQFKVMPAAIAENTKQYYIYDNAEQCHADYGNQDVIYGRKSGGYTLPYQTYSGRGARIGSNYTDLGYFTLDINLGPVSGYNPFKSYGMENFTTRVVYQNTYETINDRFNHNSTKKSGTVMTEWGDMTIEGDGVHTISDIMVLVADLKMPGNKTYTATTQEGIPTLWLACGERIRPANDSITKSILADMKLKVSMVPKYSQSEEEIIIAYFEATEVDNANGKICFTAVSEAELANIEISDEDKDKVKGVEDLRGQEWRIIYIEDAAVENEYALQTMFAKEDGQYITMEPYDTGYTVSAPITDVAGNPVELVECLDYTTKKVYLDAVSPIAVEATLSGSMIKNNSDEEIARPDMFAGNGDTVSMSIKLSEQVSLVNGASKDDIYLVWNVTDANGNYITTKLKEIGSSYSSANTARVSELIFEDVVVSSGMQGIIKPKELVGAENLKDAFNNLMNGDISKACPDRSIGIDAVGPELILNEENIITYVNTSNEKYYVYELQISDGDDVGEITGAGIITSQNEALKQYISLSASQTVDNLKWQFEISESASQLDEFTGNSLSVTNKKDYQEFSLYSNGQKFFLHVHLTTEEETELDDNLALNIEFELWDAKENKSEISLTSLTELGFDAKAPTVQVTPQAVQIERDTEDSTANVVTFGAQLEASDLNGIQELSYQWIEVGAEPAENNWIIVESGTIVECVNTVAVSEGKIGKQLCVKAIDTAGNETRYESEEGSFTANVTRVNAQYEIVYDSQKLGGIGDIKVLTPIATDGTTGGYTRAIIETATGVYVVVYEYTEDNLSETYSLFDTSVGSWYLITKNTDGTYATVEEGQAPDWDTYYEEIAITFAASANDLTPVVGETITPSAEDSTFQEGRSFGMFFTCESDEVHNISVTGVMSSSGTTLSKVTNTAEGYADYYDVGTKLAGVRFNFTITNTIISGLGSRDVDFSKSYAVFVKADENSALYDADGNPVYTVITEQIALAAGNEQSIAVPYSASGYASGAYAMIVYIAQKGGGEQEFVISDMLLLDDESPSSNAGVTEYTREVTIAYDRNNSMQKMDLSEYAQEGEFLHSVDIGIAERNDTATITYVDGKPAFTMTTSNGTGGSGISFITLYIEGSGIQALGQTLGKVAGVRYWNQASSGDPSLIELNNGIEVYSSVFADAYAEAVISLPFAFEGTVVDEETLTQTDVSDFKLMKGRNVICYQWELENGKSSPIYSFEINLYDEAPEIELSYVIGDNITKIEYIHENYYYYPIKDSEYERTYAQSFGINVDSAYSENGQLTVYRATYNTETGSYDCWQFEEVDASSTIPILAETINGYYGLSGTKSVRIDGSYEAEGVPEFYIFMDEVGNTCCYYPIISDALSEADPIYDENGYAPVYETDEEGNQWATMDPDGTSTMYYFTTDKMIGSLDVSVYEDPEASEYFWHDGVSQVLAFNTAPSDVFDQVSITIDERKEVFLDSLEEYTAGINQAGIVKFDGYYLYYVFPYDQTVAEGEFIEHTVVVKGYIDGKVATNIDGNEAIATFTVEAENVKPAIVQNGTPELGKAYVSATTQLYAEGITENTESGMFSNDFAMPIYMDGTYTQGFYDKYGVYYDLAVDITNMPADPSITVSSTELTADPVEVVITSDSGTLTVDTSVTLPDGSTITGNGTSNLTVVMADNGDFEVICTYADGSTETIAISITNIFNDPIVPIVVWDYNEYKVNPENNTYEGEVTVSIVDENGSALTDLATGLTPSYTFVPGGETSYTFTNYVNVVGVVGADVVVTLPVTLITGTTDNTESDIYAPDVAITGHAKFQSGTITLDGAVVSVDENRPGYGTDEQVVSLPNYTDTYGEAYIYEQVDDLTSQIEFANMFIFKLDIGDENDVKLFLAADKDAEAPAYDTGVSDAIEGVSIVGRTLQISKNADFALHVVDNAGNATSFDFTVTNLGDTAPAPSTTSILTKTGDEVRVYLTEPALEGVSDLTITNASSNVGIESDTTSKFYGLPYIAFTENYPDGVTIFYSYMYQGQKVTGSVIVAVTELDDTSLTENKREWSGNYDGTGAKTTNQDITVQLEFSKNLSNAYLCDEAGNLIYTPSGVTVAYVGNEVTVIYEGNVEALYLKVVHKEETNIVSLPAISTIDKIPATLSATKEFSDNHRMATVTITSNETVIWPNGTAGTEYTLKWKANGTTKVQVADKAGNASEITIELVDIIEEDLTLVLSTGASEDTILDPANDQVDIGDIIYVKTNRTAMLTLNGSDTGVRADAGVWTEITITEDSEGLYPSIRAVDEYGNSAMVQLLQIPIKDRTAPSILLNKNQVSASLDATEDELEEILRNNYVASDNATASENLKFRYEVANVSTAGTYAVTYYVTDEAGNEASASGWIRFYSGQEISIMVNGEIVERDETIMVSAGTQEITIIHNGEPYKVEWRSGIKSLGQMKNKTNVLTDYTEETQKVMTIELTESGYYTFLVTTQGRDTYRFVLYVEK